jgi:bifunctional ADP-heptose synthase (sugar kinase/adenylyltransferase)
MDTREKIREKSALSAGAAVVSGQFDPLLAAHAEWLAEARGAAGALCVVVTDPADPLLPAHARAALVAALAVVDEVVVDGAGAPAATVHLEERETPLRAAFLARVRERQS